MSTDTPTPPVETDSTNKLLIILCHVSVFLGVGLVLPLVVYLVKKQDSPLVADHAKEALNFHITAFIAFIASWILCFIIIGFLLLPVIGIGVVVLAIIAAIKASDGGFYKYPFTLRLVK